MPFCFSSKGSIQSAGTINRRSRASTSVGRSYYKRVIIVLLIEKGLYIELINRLRTAAVAHKMEQISELTSERYNSCIRINRG